jgi:hypothetical protein
MGHFDFGHPPFRNGDAGRPATQLRSRRLRPTRIGRPAAIPPHGKPWRFLAEVGESKYAFGAT